MFDCGSAITLFFLIVATVRVFDCRVITESVEQQKNMKDRTQIMFTFDKLVMPSADTSMTKKSPAIESCDGEPATFGPRVGVHAPLVACEGNKGRAGGACKEISYL